MPRFSTAARVTVVAGLVSALLAGGFAFWIRHEVYTSRYEVLQKRARLTMNMLVGETEVIKGTSRTPMSLEHPATDDVFEIVDDKGELWDSGNQLWPFQGHTRPLQPVPLSGEESEWLGGHYVTIGSPDAKHEAQESMLCQDPHISDRCALIKRMTGQRVEIFRRVWLLKDFRWRGEPARDMTDPRAVAITVFVLPFEAEDAVADVDRVLKPALPLAVLLIMLGAYVGTRTALRPVERMRAQAAAISQRNLHERVPVPPTGDVVARLATTLNETLGRLEVAAEQQRGFVADAAHELRSPIASLRAILEVANAHPDRADWPRVSDTAIEETRRLQQLADDLLLVAKLDAEPMTKHEPVDLAELVRRQLARRVDEGPELAFDAAESVLVPGEAAQLDRLVRNLIDNAIRHTRTMVAVSIEQQDGNVVLRVDDDGTGIPEPDRERVFERFTRLDEARSRDAGGAGLGLAIAHEIALHHDGTVTASETPTGGARLTLVLPQV
ncbi:HAMP domain-containing histidine kinase [Kribbella sp. NBC_01505]|uniref:sensor histidine kinase n=1 Tax=Kribbella sp. NBC_01505 TaxID=2903580 RepID=UPI00386471CC